MGLREPLNDLEVQGRRQREIRTGGCGQWIEHQGGAREDLFHGLDAFHNSQSFAVIDTARATLVVQPQLAANVSEIRAPVVALNGLVAELSKYFSLDHGALPVVSRVKGEKNDVKSFWLDIVRNVKPGVTELYIHAALPTDELKAITGAWSTRSQEFEVFTRDEELKKLRLPIPNHRFALLER